MMEKAVEEDFEEEGMVVDFQLPDDDSDVHPLCRTVVASSVLSYLAFGDLKAVRLVCRSWEEEARLHLSNRAKVVLNSDDRLQAYMIEFIGNRALFDTLQLGPFMYLRLPLADRFFQLYGIFIKQLILQKTQCSAVHLREILFRWAPNVQALTLHGMTPGKSRLLEDLHVYERSNLNNLRRLDLNLMLTQGEDLLRDFLYDLLSVSPNLENISVPRTSYKGFLSALISTLLDSPDLPLDNLTKVEALFSFGDGQIEQLTARAFPLENLNLQLLPNVTLELLLPLLESLSPSLKNLRLYFYLTRFKELPCPLELDRLESLFLDTYQGSLRFTSKLPRLRELGVTMKCVEELQEAFPREDLDYGFWSCKTLRTFSAALSVAESCPPRLVAKLRYSFPGLRSVSLQGLTDSSLSMLLSSYPNLEELDAPQGIYTDVALTGMPLERIKLLSLSLTLDDPACLANLCRQYVGNVMNLNRLRKLKVQSQGITDASIFFGVLHCKEIKELAIERSDITDKGIDAIVNHLDLHRLGITLCTRVSGPQLELVKDKMKNRKLQLDFDEKRYSMYD